MVFMDDSRERAKMLLNDFYYGQVLGYYPQTVDENISLCTIAHLIDNDFTVDEICEELKKHDTEIIKPEDLSNDLWKDSLLERGHFYFHKKLQIQPKAVLFDTVSMKPMPQEDWIEMRIRFTAKDVVNYFYSQISKNDRELCDEKTDLKTVAYMVRRFKNIENVESVDLILCLIDVFVKNQNNRVNNGLIDVLNELSNVLPQYKKDYLEANARGYNKIRWRHYDRSKQL